MVVFKIATNDDIDLLMSSRLEMLKVVNNLPQDYEYSDEIVSESRDYFLNGDQVTVLALDGDVVRRSYRVVRPLHTGMRYGGLVRFREHTDRSYR